MKKPSSLEADQYAVDKGFALKTFFIDCIRRGNRSDIENQVNICQLQEEIEAVFQDDADALLCGVMLAWSQYARAAVEGGLSEVAASNIYLDYFFRAKQAATVKAISELSVDILMDYSEAVATAQRESGNMLLIYRCREYIRERIYEKISVQDLADCFHFSRGYFSQNFKKLTGQSIQQFIQQEKIMEAKRLLKFTSLSIIDISYRLGFCSQSYFCSIFKQVCGMTPGQYRNKVT